MEQQDVEHHTEPVKYNIKVDEAQRTVNKEKREEKEKGIVFTGWLYCVRDRETDLSVI